MVMSKKKLFNGAMVLVFESRLADAAAKLLHRHGAQTISAPSMKETPLENHSSVFAFADELFSGRVDMLICLTGVGTEMLIKTLNTKYRMERTLQALTNTIILSRGPKPANVLRNYNIPIDINVPEPNTWKEILEIMDSHPLTDELNGKTVAIQEYGESNEMLYAELLERGGNLIKIPIYRWELPDDLGPLKKGISAVLDGKVNIVLFTSKTQSGNVVTVAESMGVKEEFIKTINDEVTVASIGPVCSRGLREIGIEVDFEPTRPKLAILVREVAEKFSNN